MPTNRTINPQFAPGCTLDGTRIERALRGLVDQFNEVPAAMLGRRWSPSTLAFGLTPSKRFSPRLFQWQQAVNDATLAGSSLQPPTAFQNPQRVKSSNVPAIDTQTPGQYLATWETSFATPEPAILGGVSVFAEMQQAGASPRYTNYWQYGAAAPAPYVNGDPSDDFTFQAAISDGWDIENRRKLRQELLLYNMRSDAFWFYRSAVAVADTLTPPHPLSAFRGRALVPAPLVLLPAGARVFIQLTLPRYSNPAAADWGAEPAGGNVWSMAAQLWRATR